MPSLSLYKKINPSPNIGAGYAHKEESDTVMNATWYDDISSRIGYFYDCYHCNSDEKYTLKNLRPEDDDAKVPVEIKFLQNASQTMDKDLVTFHIQLRPGFDYTQFLSYYKDDFVDKYDAIFPVGLYVDIPDESGVYNRWLVVGTANYYSTQFPTYDILPCNFVIQYIFNNLKYQFPVALRSQNSYNSGIWSDHLTTSVEDQQKFIIPLNDETEHIFYNLRIIMDNKIKTEPRAWKVSKVNRISTNGLAMVTLAQDAFDQNKDYIEYDIDGKIIGMWADYYLSGVIPEDSGQVTHNIHCDISYSSTSPEIKIGTSSYKKFDVTFYDGEEIIETIDGNWTITSEYKYNNHDISEFIETKEENHQLQIRLPKSNEINMWIGKTLTITYTTEDAETSASYFIAVKST